MRDRVLFRMHVHNLQIFVSCLKIFLKQRSTTQGNHKKFVFPRNDYCFNCSVCTYNL